MEESVGVILPAWNDAAGLPHAVASVLNQHGVTVSSIVIAVGPSDDDTLHVAKTLAEKHDVVSVISNPSGRTPEALNLAIKATDADIVARVDARSELPANYLSFALECMRETNAANVGAIQWPVGKTVTQRGVAAAMRSPIGSGGAAYRGAKKRRRVDTAYLGVFRRSALLEVGGFDETFIRNQDAELNLRLAAAGHEVWLDPRLVVEYAPRATVRALASQYWQYGWWRQLTGRKHQRSLRLRQLVPPIVVVCLVACLALGLLWSPVWLVPVGLYLVLLVVAALLQGSGGLRERLAMSTALGTMHLAWGCGFLTSFARSTLGLATREAKSR